MLRWCILFCILMFIACGVHVNPEAKEIKIPTKLSVEIPESIKDQNLSSSNNLQKKLEYNKIFQPDYNPREAIGSEELNKKTSLVDFVINDIQFNVFLQNSVITEIERKCRNVGLNKLCTLEKNSVELNVTEALVSKYEKFYPEDFRINESSIGTSITFDLVEFIKYDENQEFQYSLNTNMTTIYNNLFNKVKVFDPDFSYMIQNVQWSEDNNSILSTLTSSFVGSEVNHPWVLYFEKEENVQERMHFFRYEKPLRPDEENVFNFELIKHLNAKVSHTFTLNELIKGYSFTEVRERGYASFGKIQDNIAYNSYVNNSFTFDSKIKTDEIYDENGSIIASTYCDGVGCSYADTSTWFTNTQDDAQFDFFKGLIFHELNVVGGDLKDGEYFLLASDFNVTNLSIDSVQKESIGSFVVLNGKRQGAVYSDEYVNKLETLQLVYAKHNHIHTIPLANRGEENFEIILSENLPTFFLFP